MTDNALWKRLSSAQKHEMAAPANDWQVRRARCIEAGLPPSSSKKSSEDDGQTMEETSDDEPTPTLSVGFTMAQAQAHYEAIMAAKEQPARCRRSLCSGCCRKSNDTTYGSSSITGSQRAQIAGEQANKDAVTAMSRRIRRSDVQRTLYQSTCSARNIRLERWRLHVMRVESEVLHEICPVCMNFVRFLWNFF